MRRRRSRNPSATSSPKSTSGAAWCGAWGWPGRFSWGADGIPAAFTLLQGYGFTSAPKPPDCRGNRPVMATRQQPAEPRRPAPRLYLVTPPTAEPARLAETLADALGGAEVAAVL